MSQLYNIPCNIAQTLNIIGDKWTMLILRQLMIGRRTYKEILDGLEGIPSNLLSKRLKGLEEDGLVEASLYCNHPPRYEYLLTESGKDLNDIFYSLLMWGEKHISTCDKQIQHKECGNKVDHMYYCPECEKVVDKEEISIISRNASEQK